MGSEKGEFIVQRLTLFDPVLILLKPLAPMLWQKEVPPEGTQDRE
ncbi:hypothetical protein A2U01_0037189, partial [Trifolium medium]|nr:hypothetical protein [Trifolium medium]